MDFGLVIISFTIACALIGGLLGLIRGQNRSILRLILVLASAVVAFMMRETLVDMILGLEVQGQPLSAVINEALLSGASLPQQLVNFINMIIEILITTIVFIIVFGALSFVTWLILFQILKIFFLRSYHITYPVVDLTTNSNAIKEFYFGIISWKNF